MCNVRCIIFGAKNFTREEVEGKKILEVGSYDVNGTIRPVIELLNPLEYVGIDIEKGPGVDIVCKAEDIIKEFGKESFDIVISTELLEHIINWRKVISNFKNICKSDGIILITTRSYGCHYHGYPHDFWRYEIQDMNNIFSDCIIEKIEPDNYDPGVFIKVRKPKKFIENDLSDYKLYSMILKKRVKKIYNKNIKEFIHSYSRRQKFKQIYYKGIEKSKQILTKLFSYLRIFQYSK